ncbi:MAG: RagB/SusD family nutrient uptake outer membrane protein [Flavobacteriaceae bacterium]|nr:RagB/SusD family nutrient uptake outer membrane protein [Flavobacteriaceae bacterium]
MKKCIILLNLITTFGFVSCNDFIDVTPISEETTANAYNTAGQIEAALTGTYESFHSAEYYVWDFILFQDVRTDNCYAGGDNPEIFQINNYEIETTHSRIFTHWSNIYNAIAKANLVLDRVDLVNDPVLTEERRLEITGEAHFLRAYHYFTLVKMFGGVPLITSPVTSAEGENVEVARASVEDVYEQIIEDLEIAVALLPDTYGSNASINKGRATSGAAHALAAKVHAQKPSPNYMLVLEHIQELEGSSANYQLIDFAQLFDGNNYNNAESILEVQYLGQDFGNYGPQLLLPPSISGDAWRKFATPSVDLVNAFDEENDEVRKNASIIFEAVQWNDEFWGNSSGSTIPFSYKWKNANGFASADNTYLLRYGDLVLLKAEALNELGELNQAVTEVNKIRNRAQLPDLTNEQSNSQEVLRQSILKERRLELFQEGHRWDDLVRNGELINTMNNLEEIDLRTGNPVQYNVTPANLLLPIPQQELDRNPALIQNPL